MSRPVFPAEVRIQVGVNCPVCGYRLTYVFHDLREVGPLLVSERQAAGGCEHLGTKTIQAGVLVEVKP